jgi:hypothetical protein
VTGIHQMMVGGNGGGGSGLRVFTRDWNDNTDAGQTFYTATHSVDGSLRFTMANTANTNVARTTFDALTTISNSFDLSIDIQFPVSTKTCGIFFAATQGANDITNGYRCDISQPNGTQRIIRFTGGAATVLKSQNPVDGDPNLLTTMRVVWNTPQIDFYMTGPGVEAGAELHTTDSTYTSGEWGMLAFANPFGPTTHFNNLVVYY